MAECVPEANASKLLQNPKADVKNSNKVAAESTPVAVFRARPADLGLTRSLSKSDSDLLASPLGEEDGGLVSRSGSMSNCRSGHPSKERMPSFASEWDEVIFTLWGWETSGRVEVQAFTYSVLLFLRESVNECDCIRRKEGRWGI